MLLIGVAFAAPSLPHVFNGEVIYSGDPSMSLSGYKISASVGGYGVGIVGSVNSNNTYEIFVDPQGHAGEITFYVGGVEAEEKGDYEWGGFSPNFNLTINEVPTDATCGNSLQEPGEQCDNLDLGVGTCENVLGITGATGTLSCTSFCTFDYSNCTAPSCGDGVCPGSPSSPTSSPGGSSPGSSSSGGTRDVIVLSTDDKNKSDVNLDSDLTNLPMSNQNTQSENLRKTDVPPKQSFFKKSSSQILIVLIFLVLIVIAIVMGRKMKQDKKVKATVSNVQASEKKVKKKKAPKK